MFEQMAQENTRVCGTRPSLACTVGNNKKAFSELIVICVKKKRKKRQKTHVLHHSVPSQHQPSGLSCPRGSPFFIYLHVVNKTLTQQ